MTTQELINYYANLLIIQYRQKPKAYATIQALADMAVMDQLPIDVQNAFNIETAVGDQLDILGKYIGATRNGYNATGPVTLSDSDFRTLLKFVIITNTAGSSLYTIQTLLAGAFPGQVFISDSTTMTINYVLLESLGTPDLLEVIVRGGYLPKPMGVGVSATIVPVHDNSYFGFRTYAAPDPSVAPFNNYTLYQTIFPWFTYNI